MERDFLGLSNKQYLGNNVKLELGLEDPRELGLSKKVAKQWGKTKVFATSNFISATNPQEAKPVPGAYQPGSVSAASLFRRSQFCGSFQNQKPVLVGGVVPLTTHPSLLPLLNSSTDPRTVSSGSSPQLTIFYGGTVNVFHDISPEKAQAIMLCAANGLSSPLDKTKSHQTKDRVYGRQNLKVSPKAAAAAAVSVSSSSGTESDSASMSIDKPITTNTNAMNMNMIGSFCSAARNMIPSVPQARKASLARFLEKRKERLMNATPYAMSKKKLLDFSTGESSGMNYTSTSAV